MIFSMKQLKLIFMGKKVNKQKTQNKQPKNKQKNFHKQFYKDKFLETRIKNLFFLKTFLCEFYTRFLAKN